MLGKVDAGKSPRGTRIIIVWSWAFFAILTYSIVWFILAPIHYAIVQAFSDLIPAPYDQIANILILVMEYHPIMAVFGWLIWAFINSARRDVQQYAV